MASPTVKFYHLPGEKQSRRKFYPVDNIFSGHYYKTEKQEEK